MSSQGEVTLPATRRARKSIGGGSSRKASDQENATVDLGSSAGTSLAANRKKSRSKSIGPGGLDILKSGTGNRRASLAVPSRPPRSILKPTMPLLPEIPPHNPRASSRGPEVSGMDKLANPFDSGDNGGSGTKVALRTEEEQQAAAREREERERAELEKEIKDRREARRKSLANRRVSFAAEATLHTFHEVEEAHDSTTSSSSTRRQSSAPAPPPQPEHPDSDGFGAPSSPLIDVHETVSESPANQRRRRSSGVMNYSYDDDTMNSTVYDSDGDDVAEIQEEMTDSSNSDEEDGTMMTVEEITSASVASARSAYSSADSSGTIDENLRLAARMATTQRVDDEEEEVIAGFAGWGRKNPVPPNVTRDVPDITLNNIVPENISDNQDQGSDMEMEMTMDMDMTNAVGGILRPRSESPAKDQDQDEEEEMEMSMDVTKALGGILPKPKPQTRRKSMKPVQPDDTSYGEQTMDFTMAVGGIQHGGIPDGNYDNTEINEDMSMELTAAIGDVLAGRFSKFTQENHNTAAPAEDDDDGQSMMEMTTAVGRILPSAQEDEEEEDQTMGMEMTMAVGGILKSLPDLGARSAAKKVMEQEADEPDPSLSPSIEIRSPKRRRSTVADENGSPAISAFQGKSLLRSPTRSPTRSVSPVAKPPKAPSVSPVRNSPPKARSVSPVRSSPHKEQSLSPVRNSPPKTRSRSLSPVRNSPPKAPSLSPVRNSPPKNATTPIGQSPARSPSMLGSRSSSPIRDGTPIARTTPRSPSKFALFHHDPATGASIPHILLTPQARRLSGLGADRPGLGSPRVAEIIDRRESIGDVAAEFVPSSATGVRRGVAFASPRVMEIEVDRERQEEVEREDSRRILEREADGSQDEREVTLNLKEMIQSMSPKKNIFRGRKSLHVGSARGLLGKRPAELDDEEEAEERDGIKRLKGHQGSPVKNVKLHSPPSKEETTTGRKTRSARRSPERTDENTTTTPILPSSPFNATTPRPQGRFMNIPDDQPTNTMDFDHTAAIEDAERFDDDDDGERIHLQDFLNMTSIRFMELTTTKRRHTIVPSAPRDSSASDTSATKDDISLENCVVAGACTVPMLELYQHSCRELKKYISEGRRIVRDIESETFEENPPLFKEYMTATPEFKVLMDSQFKNVKSHARLLSKAMWYEWRMKLQEGLREGLVKIAEGMDEDERVLGREAKLISGVLPGLVKRFEGMVEECEELEAAAREMAECDPGELAAARGEVAVLGAEIKEKRGRIEELRRGLEEDEGKIEGLVRQKEVCLGEIREAERVREECRGWSSGEIGSLKAKVEALEKQHGWAITAISGTNISMSYKREIELFFNISSFQQQQNSNPQATTQTEIDLWYIGATRERNPIPSTPEKQFFLERIRDHVRSTFSNPNTNTNEKHTVSQLLNIVSKAWEKANLVSEQIRMMNLTFPTSVRRVAEGEGIEVVCSLLVPVVKARFEVVLGLKCVSSGEMGAAAVLQVEVVPDVMVVYGGEGFNLGRMREFLGFRVGREVASEKEKEGWSEVVVEMQKRLVAKGVKLAGGGGK